MSALGQKRTNRSEPKFGLVCCCPKADKAGYPLARQSSILGGLSHAAANQKFLFGSGVFCGRSK